MALNCKYQDFVTDKFNETGIFDMISKKAMTTDNIQAALLEHSRKFGDDGGFVMRAHCEDGFLPYTKSNLYNSKGKERSFDLDNGEAMNYCDFESVRNAWGVGSIEALTYQSNTTLHVGTGRAFYLRYSGGLVDEILDNKWTPREETVGGGLWAEQQ